MAAFRSAIVGLAEAILNFNAVSSPSWQVTMHVRTADGSANTVAKLDGLAAALANLVSVTFPTTMLNASNSFAGVTARDLSPALLPDSFIAEAINGTRAGGALANDSTLVVTQKTAQVGRSFRGRCYFSGLAPSDLDSVSAFKASVAEEFEDYVEQWRNACVAAAPQSYTPVIYHRRAGSSGVPAADSTTPITSNLGRIVVASQRRRTLPIRR